VFEGDLQARCGSSVASIGLWPVVRWWPGARIDQHWECLRRPRTARHEKEVLSTPSITSGARRRSRQELMPMMATPGRPGGCGRTKRMLDRSARHSN
jgi:hypothetical protein